MCVVCRHPRCVHRIPGSAVRSVRGCTHARLCLRWRVGVWSGCWGCASPWSAAAAYMGESLCLCACGSPAKGRISLHSRLPLCARACVSHAGARTHSSAHPTLTRKTGGALLTRHGSCGAAGEVVLVRRERKEMSESVRARTPRRTQVYHPSPHTRPVETPPSKRPYTKPRTSPPPRAAQHMCTSCSLKHAHALQHGAQYTSRSPVPQATHMQVSRRSACTPRPSVRTPPRT